MVNICELIVVDGKDDFKGQILLIHEDQSRTVGRSSACDYQIDDEQLSGMHCQFVHRDGNWMVRDLLSRNGVSVNEKLVHAESLSPGDQVQIGNTRIEFGISGKDSASDPPKRKARVIPLDGKEHDPMRQTRMVEAPPDDGGGDKITPLGRLIEKRSDLELAKLALKNDLLDHTQLKECIDIQAEMREVKIHMTLEEIFQEREYLAKDEIQKLIREYKYTRRRTKDLFYAEVAIGNKLVPSETIQDCLKLQEEAFKSGDKIPYLGELLVKKGHISIKDNNKVIRGIKQYKESDEETRASARTKAAEPEDP